MINVVTAQQDWYSILQEINNYDFYHTYDYHQLSKKEEEEPLLLVYREKNVLIALPLLIRTIANSAYCDATSVYGYGGPLVSGVSEDYDFSKCHMALNTYFDEKKIISVFSRLHPYFPMQEKVITNLGSIEDLGRVVNIDLTKTLEEQVQQYSNTTKRYLKKGLKTISIVVSNKKEDIDTFIALYNENMERVNAKKHYFFNDEYFLQFANSTEFTTEFTFAVLNETQKIISAAMIIKTNSKFVQYHLSGTLTEYLHLTPIRLLIDAARISGTNEGYTYFNLGGGLGSNNDSLYSFKSSFSDDFKQFKIWKYIVNHEKYNELVAQNPSLQEKETDTISFFPLYRFDA
jgi:lipid II:glycine glycyltransferase (peptidoglycan interpeptide bridge formation enzyme)